MKILAIDTTREQPVAVLISDDTTTVLQGEGDKPNKALMPLIDRILKENGTDVSEIDAFGAVVGAGSFTGIRVGIATVSAFAYALKKPLISVTAFDIITEGKDNALALVDALHGAWYAALKKDGEFSFSYVEADEALPLSETVLKQSEISGYNEKFAHVVRKKFDDGEFVPVLVPLYLRASQAERNAK